MEYVYPLFNPSTRRRVIVFIRRAENPKTEYLQMRIYLSALIIHILLSALVKYRFCELRILSVKLIDTLEREFIWKYLKRFILTVKVITKAFSHSEIKIFTQRLKKARDKNK